MQKSVRSMRRLWIAGISLFSLACEGEVAAPAAQPEPEAPSLPQLARVVVSLDTASIRVGEQTNASVEGFASDGSVVALEAVSWSSSNVAVATVDSAGLVRALGEGRVDILASVGAISGKAALGVEPEALKPWSAAESWPDGRVPVEGDSVRVPAGSRIVLDVSPPRLAALDIQGALVIEGGPEAELELQAGWIKVAGQWRIGSSAAPFLGRLQVTLDGSPDHPGMGMGGNRAIAVMAGGRMEVYGERRTSWTHLGASVAAGASQITLATDADWREGDRIVIAPSGTNPHEAEHRVISAVSGRTLTLESPLDHPHFGEIQQIAGRAVDQRAEVGLLTRNIRIMGISDDPDGPPFSWSGYGGTLMIMADGWSHIEGIELVNMGQRGRIGRYPMHWHVAGDVWGQKFVNNSIWRSHNRCVTIHGTQQAHVEDNVCYDHVGHGFFFEEGSEVGNRLLGNLGILTRRPRNDQMVTQADELASTFWVTNPDNLVRGNVAAGSEAFGIWYALPPEPTGFTAGTPHRPSKTPIWEFKNNTTHSNRRTGFFVGSHGLSDGTTAGDWYNPMRDPLQEWSDRVVAVFDDLNAYKNHEWGAWLAGSGMLLSGAVLADNEAASLLQAGDTYVESSFIVGESDNPIGGFDFYRGFEFYDGPVGVRRSAFARFGPSSGALSSALAFKKHLPEPVHVENGVSGIEVLDDSRPVWIDRVEPWNEGHKSVVFQDETGSLTPSGKPWITAARPFLTTPECEARPEWNAQVCPGPYLMLQFNAEQNMGAFVQAERDDGEVEEFKPSTSGRNVTFTLMPGRRYDFDMERPSGPLNLYLRGAGPNQWVDVVFPYRGDLSPIFNNVTQQFLQGLGTREALSAAQTSAYWYDRANSRLHMRIHSGPRPNDWAQAHIQLTIGEI